MRRKWYVKNSKIKGKGEMNMEEMVEDLNCAYCMQGKLVARFGYPVYETNTGILYVFREQSKKGGVILARKKHVSELTDLTDRKWNNYFVEIAQVSRAVHRVFNPGEVSYDTYGDTGRYLHFHIVPKYRDGGEWGGTFEISSRRTMLPDGEYEEMAEALRKVLKEV